jgi:tetratricopeptide (TPR) repeat protein
MIYIFVQRNPFLDYSPIFNLACVYSNIGNKDKALKYYEDSLRIMEEISDKAGIATSYNNIGGIYSNIGDKDKALKCYEDSLRIRKEIGDKEGIAASYNNIGGVGCIY